MIYFRKKCLISTSFSKDLLAEHTQNFFEKHYNCTREPDGEMGNIELNFFAQKVYIS